MTVVKLKRILIYSCAFCIDLHEIVHSWNHGGVSYSKNCKYIGKI